MSKLSDEKWHNKLHLLIRLRWFWGIKTNIFGQFKSVWKIFNSEKKKMKFAVFLLSFIVLLQLAQVHSEPECGLNEIFKECGTYCETDCPQVINQENRICVGKCKIGCFCRPGFVRRSPEDRTCVEKHECRP